jgi:hypothetical protein
MSSSYGISGVLLHCEQLLILTLIFVYLTRPVLGFYLNTDTYKRTAWSVVTFGPSSTGLEKYSFTQSRTSHASFPIAQLKI